MKNHTKKLSILLVLMLLLAVFAGCGEKANAEFTASNGIDDSGYFKGVKAKNYVELFDYEAFPIPAEARTVDEQELTTAIHSFLNEYAPKVKDRAVENGDQVNIDYVGSVDGVEFEGGNTNMEGTLVTAGSTDYIDDFLTQIIGQMPGHTIDVNVTFPEVYQQNPDLAGKEALFVTTINYIVGTAELTDEFVLQNFVSTEGWKTSEDLKEAKRKELRQDIIIDYIRTYMTTDVTIKSIPKKLTKYQEDSLVNYYEDYAKQSGMGLDDFLNANSIATDKADLIEQNKEMIESNAKYFLVVQAIAEDLKLTLSEADLVSFFTEQMGNPDYSQYVERFGMPYIKQNVLCEKILSYIADHAVMA